MTMEELKERKRELGYSNRQLAEESGVPLGTIQKIFGGETKAPRKETLDALHRVLFQENALPGLIREAMPAYGERQKQPGEFTKEDYYALPDDVRMELIDGVFYDMASPSRIHQGILGGLYIQLDACVQKHAGNCFIYMAPSDIELGENTVVQPDLYIHCRPEKETIAPMDVAPDFAVEILSPSNPGHDIWRKQELYRRYGVREYWIVDPRNKRVMVFPFEKQELPSSYTFEDIVPVGISGGECQVDFRQVFARVRHLYES